MYVQWGRKTCTNDHNTEYYGVIMSSHHGQKKNEFICVDWERAYHKTNNNGDQNLSINEVVHSHMGEPATHQVK